MIKTLPPETITVRIRPEPFNPDTYYSAHDCYLAKALHQFGYDSAVVGKKGHCTIDGYCYAPIQDFGADIVEEHFRNNKAIALTLVRGKRFNVLTYKSPGSDFWYQDLKVTQVS